MFKERKKVREIAARMSAGGEHDYSVSRQLERLSRPEDSSTAESINTTGEDSAPAVLVKNLKKTFYVQTKSTFVYRTGQQL